jgi:hypothetical protein
MEDPMTLSITRRRIIPILSALAFVTGLPDVSLAMAAPSTGLWKVDIAKSKFGTGSSTVIVERAKASDGTTRTFLVINGGKAYLATAAANASNGVAAVDYSSWKGMKLVQIGANVRAKEECYVRCQFGVPSARMILTFRTVNAGRQPMADLLALANK